MTTIAFYATGKHLVEHLFHLYDNLPTKYRGIFYARGRAADRAQELGIDVIKRSVPQDERSLVCVASQPDYRSVNPAKVILVNHGVGQTYSDGRGLHHSGYSGGAGRERVVLNLCPSERDADLCRASGQQAVAIGVPYLDGFHVGPPPLALSEPVNTVAFSFHADIQVVAETQWAFPHYETELTNIIRREDRPFDIIGHCHPRMYSHFRTFWARRKVPFVESWWDVMEETDLYVCDNSSTLYEFASTGRPVLVLNAPWYRRNVEHGMRFWSHIPGITVDEPEFLYDGILEALEDLPRARELRAEAVDYAYGDLCDGKATERAVNAVVDFMESR
jgi:hypothetical protein